MKNRLQTMHDDITADDLSQALEREWYFVSKIMGTILPRDFPYFTMKGILRQIKEDPNFKSEDSNKTKEG